MTCEKSKGSNELLDEAIELIKKLPDDKLLYIMEQMKTEKDGN